MTRSPTNIHKRIGNSYVFLGRLFLFFLFFQYGCTDRKLFECALIFFFRWKMVVYHFCKQTNPWSNYIQTNNSEMQQVTTSVARCGVWILSRKQNSSTRTSSLAIILQCLNLLHYTLLYFTLPCFSLLCCTLFLAIKMKY